LVPVQGPTPHKAVFLFKGCQLEAEYIEYKPKTSGLRLEVAWMTQHKVVVHYKDGQIVKGHTSDFMPTKISFHVTTLVDHKETIEVAISLLKAVFFVKTFEGDKNHLTHEIFSMENFTFDDVSPKVSVHFLDGEVMYGMTNGYEPDRMGFFLFPADKKTNNERVFVIKESTASVTTWR
jgi:hypothetical protein